MPSAMLSVNSDGRVVRGNAYTLVSAKDKTRRPGDVIPCGCGREGCTFVFDIAAARQEYRTDSCREWQRNKRRRRRNQVKREVRRTFRR